MPTPYETLDTLLDSPSDPSQPLVSSTLYDYRSDPGITPLTLAEIDLYWAIYKRPKLDPLPPPDPAALALGKKAGKPHWYRPKPEWDTPKADLPRDPDDPSLPAMVLAQPNLSNTHPLNYEARMHNAFIERIATEPDIQTALSRVGSSKFTKFLGMLLDPQYARKRWTATALARACQITPIELERAWREHKLAEAMMVIVEKMPDIAADMAEDARSVMISCPRCEGWGKIEKALADGSFRSAACPNCSGKKIVRKSGDADSRKYILDSVGWTGKQAGTIVNHGIQNNSNGSLDDFDSLGSVPSLPSLSQPAILEAEADTIDLPNSDD